MLRKARFVSWCHERCTYAMRTCLQGKDCPSDWEVPRGEGLQDLEALEQLSDTYVMLLFLPPPARLTA